MASPSRVDLSPQLLARLQAMSDSSSDTPRGSLRGSLASAQKLKTEYEELTPSQKKNVMILRQLYNDFEILREKVDEADNCLFMKDTASDRDFSERTHLIIDRTISVLDGLIEDFAPLTEQRKENQIKV